MVSLKAYVLVKVELNCGRRVIEAISKLQAVKSADMVSGPYDVIVATEANDLNDIADLLVSEINAISGVTSTTTCLAVTAQ